VSVLSVSELQTPRADRHRTVYRVTATQQPPVTNAAADVLAACPPPQRLPLTPGEALSVLFLDNADRGANAENDALVVELLKRRRAIQALANPSGR
jgi:hypothetical protein